MGNPYTPKESKKSCTETVLMIEHIIEGSSVLQKQKQMGPSVGFSTVPHELLRPRGFTLEDLRNERKLEKSDENKVVYTPIMPTILGKLQGRLQLIKETGEHTPEIEESAKKVKKRPLHKPIGDNFFVRVPSKLKLQS